MPRKVRNSRRTGYRRLLTREAVQAHPLYLQLTGAQQRFISTYLETRSAPAAIGVAYPNTTPGAPATALASKLFCHPIVAKLLALGIGYSLEMGPLSRNDLAGLCAERLWGRTQGDTGFLRLLATYMWLTKQTRKGAAGTDDVAFLQGLGRYGRYADQRYEAGAKGPKLRTLAEEISKMERAGKAKESKESKESNEQIN
jgi:hypothetical protein